MRGKSLGAFFMVLVYAALILCLVLAVRRAVDLGRAWKQFNASARIALEVLEDPINQYDKLLGWKHIPGKSVPMDAAFPGEGIVFEINHNGFRGTRDYQPEKPPGIFRIIAVGDSFTFGNVKTHQTWPAQLEMLGDSYEVINMGASAYGIDQMFLWYREDGTPFDADVVICAVIRDDFWRALGRSWVSGHGRPFFRLRDDQLVLTNVPVPPRIEPGKKNIRPGDFFEFLRQRRMNRPGAEDTEKQLEVPLRILREFRDLVRSQGTRFITVYLPRQDEMTTPASTAVILKQYCEKNGVELLDLTPGLRERAGPHPSGLFRPDGHYNAAGNRYVAELIEAFLRNSSAPAAD